MARSDRINVRILLRARIHALFPLVCTKCGAEMRIIAFIADRGTVRDFLVPLNEPIRPPTFATARGPRCGLGAMTSCAMRSRPTTHSPRHHRLSSSISASPGSRVPAARRPGVAWA